MAYFSEKVAILKDFSTIKAADISTSGTIADLDTTGFSFVRLTAATELTSVLAQSSGKQVILVNASASPLLVKHLSGTAGNQINTGNGADLSLPAGATISLIYDDAGTVWVRDQYVPVVPSATDTVLQGGNSFGADFRIGSNDNFSAIIETNGAEVVRARPAAAANADVKVTGTGGVELPIGTTAQRPSTPVNGTVRVNTSTQAFEVYVNSTWNTVPGNNGVIQGGNTLGADLTIGTNDNFNTIIEANGAEVIRARPAAATDANAKISGTAGLEIPVGTTAQRPSTPVTGTLRLNSTIPALEGYYNSTWNQIGTSTVVSPILGLQTTTAIPAGFIGEQLVDFQPGGTTYFVGSGSVGSPFFLTLTPGLWEISYNFTLERAGATYSPDFRLLTWLSTTGAGFGDSVTRNGLVDFLLTSASLPQLFTNTSSPIRVAYNGTTLTLPGGGTNATGRVYLTVLSATFTGVPTYGCYMRAVRVQ